MSVETATAADRRRPLQGIRVLDFTIFVAGPYCTRQMADLGADVVKVEAPEGEMLRHSQPMRDGCSALFGQLNCGKKSIALDLKQPEALALARRMALQADVLVQNFRPGVMRRLGLDYESLKAEHPSLVYCSISGYGQSGPGAALPAFAPIVHAASGFELAQFAYYQSDGHERPIRHRAPIADILAGAHALAAIHAALFHRGQTGEGRHVEATLIDGMLNILPFELQAAHFPSERLQMPVFGPIAARDGFIIVTPVTQRSFEALAQRVGRADWLQDERFATATARFGNWLELVAELETWTRERDAADCEQAIQEAGCPCARYRTLADALQDRERLGAAAPVVADAAGAFKVPPPPFRFPDGDQEVGPRVAPLGADGDGVLREWLSLAPDEIARLHDARVLAGT